MLYYARYDAAEECLFYLLMRVTRRVMNGDEMKRMNES